MGLKGRLKHLALGRVHVLLAEVPGNFELRVAAEQAVHNRGWVLALSPADADALLVVGEPDADLQTAIDAVYDQMPGPRASARVHRSHQIGDQLDRLRNLLSDDQGQRNDAHSRMPPDQGPPAEPMDHGDMDHGEMDHGDMDHGDMDHGDMDMAPSGIPLAEGGEDRDGLEMDVTHLFLGPVLAHWPAGLVIRCTMHGDTVMEHEVLVAPLTTPAPSPRIRAAQRIDAAVDVLMLAGSHHWAETLRDLRHRCLSSDDYVYSELATERRRLHRSRLLRWSLGETHAACLALLDRAAQDLAGEPEVTHEVPPLADLINGQDLATVRLRIAAAGPDLWRTVEVG